VDALREAHPYEEVAFELYPLVELAPFPARQLALNDLAQQLVTEGGTAVRERHEDSSRCGLAKGGAEGIFCAAHDDGRGIALKAEDGAYRAIGPALALVLGIDELAETPVLNSRREIVGAITLAA